MATTDPGATDDRIRRMFETPLAERFKLSVHRDAKEGDGYALKTGSRGRKIPQAKDGGAPPSMPAWMGKGVSEDSLDGRAVAMAPTAGVLAITGRRVTMAQLAAAPERHLGAFVTDGAGLSGKYYLGFEFAQENHPPDVDLPTVFPALQDLGVKLDKRKGPVEVPVVDHVEKASTETKRGRRSAGISRVEAFAAPSARSGRNPGQLLRYLAAKASISSPTP